MPLSPHLIPVGSRLRRMAAQLVREGFECDLCERWGRFLDPASPADGPRCVFPSVVDLEDWDARATAVIETERLIREVWPGVMERPAVSRPGQRVYARSTVSLFAEVKRRVPIVAVAERLTELRGSGRSLSGRCPFHQDRTPSFVVWPKIGRFRCYGCRLRGDVVEFVRLAMEAGLWR